LRTSKAPTVKYQEKIAMPRTRLPASLAIAATFVGASVLSGTLAAPTAHASPLDDIAATVKRDRPATCPPLIYNGDLQGIAQDYARNEDPAGVQTTGNYNGTRVGFLGSGDPQARALTSAYERGAGGFLSKCDFTDFGVGFIRYDDREVDVVTIVFGKPPAAALKPAEVPPVVAPPVVVPPVVVPPVVVPEEKKPLEPPTVDFNPIFGGVAATITDHSGVASKCTYNSSIVNRDFSLPANGSATVNIVPLVPLGIDYDVHVKCDNGTSLDTTTNF
jgi:hypothetical protein